MSLPIPPSRRTHYRRRRRRRTPHRRPTAALIVLAVCAATALLIVATPQRQEAITPAAADGAAPADADAASGPPAHRRPFRRLYAYSVVPGGVATVAEVRAAIASDALVAGHYSSLDLAHATVERIKAPLRAYVSYRRGDRIYWTRQPVMLPAGERIISDGAVAIRVRCGNRLSGVAMTPVSDDEPAAWALDRASAPTGGLDRWVSPAPSDASALPEAAEFAPAASPAHGDTAPRSSAQRALLPGGSSSSRPNSTVGAPGPGSSGHAIPPRTRLNARDPAPGAASTGGSGDGDPSFGPAAPVDTGDPEVPHVPEPGTVALLVVGGVSYAVRRRRRAARQRVERFDGRSSVPSNCASGRGCLNSR